MVQSHSRGVNAFFYLGCFDIGMTIFAGVMEKKDEHEIESNYYFGLIYNIRRFC